MARAATHGAAKIQRPGSALWQKIKPLYHWPQLVLHERKRNCCATWGATCNSARRVMEEWNFKFAHEPVARA